jgi:hypothetical protein
VTPPEYWFGPPAELAEGEHWVAHLAANRSQGKRAVGGGLHLTTRRMLFTPRDLEASLGGKPWSCAVSEITAIGVEKARFSLLEMFSGGWSDRLRIDLGGGHKELFVVARAEQRATELRDLLHTPEPTAGLPVARVLR